MGDSLPAISVEQLTNSVNNAVHGNLLTPLPLFRPLPPSPLFPPSAQTPSPVYGPGSGSLNHQACLSLLPSLRPPPQPPPPSQSVPENGANFGQRFPVRVLLPPPPPSPQSPIQTSVINPAPVMNPGVAFSVPPHHFQQVGVWPGGSHGSHSLSAGMMTFNPNHPMFGHNASVRAVRFPSQNVGFNSNTTTMGSTSLGNAPLCFVSVSPLNKAKPASNSAASVTSFEANSPLSTSTGMSSSSAFHGGTGAPTGCGAASTLANLDDMSLETANVMNCLKALAVPSLGPPNCTRTSHNSSFTAPSCSRRILQSDNCLETVCLPDTAGLGPVASQHTCNTCTMPSTSVSSTASGSRVIAENELANKGTRDEKIAETTETTAAVQSMMITENDPFKTATETADDTREKLVITDVQDADNTDSSNSSESAGESEIQCTDVPNSVSDFDAHNSVILSLSATANNSVMSSDNVSAAATTPTITTVATITATVSATPATVTCATMADSNVKNSFDINNINKADITSFAGSDNPAATGIFSSTAGVNSPGTTGIFSPTARIGPGTTGMFSPTTHIFSPSAGTNSTSEVAIVSSTDTAGSAPSVQNCAAKSNSRTRSNGTTTTTAIIGGTKPNSEAFPSIGTNTITAINTTTTTSNTSKNCAQADGQTTSMNSVNGPSTMAMSTANCPAPPMFIMFSLRLPMMPPHATAVAAPVPTLQNKGPDNSATGIGSLPNPAMSPFPPYPLLLPFFPPPPQDESQPRTIFSFPDAAGQTGNSASVVGRFSNSNLPLPPLSFPQGLPLPPLPLQLPVSMPFLPIPPPPFSSSGPAQGEFAPSAPPIVLQPSGPATGLPLPPFLQHSSCGFMPFPFNPPPTSEGSSAAQSLPSFPPQSFASFVQSGLPLTSLSTSLGGSFPFPLLLPQPSQPPMSNGNAVSFSSNCFATVASKSPQQQTGSVTSGQAAFTAAPGCQSSFPSPSFHLHPGFPPLPPFPPSTSSSFCLLPPLPLPPTSGGIGLPLDCTDPTENSFPPSVSFPLPPPPPFPLPNSGDGVNQLLPGPPPPSFFVSMAGQPVMPPFGGQVLPPLPHTPVSQPSPVVSAMPSPYAEAVARDICMMKATTAPLAANIEADDDDDNDDDDDDDEGKSSDSEEEPMAIDETVSEDTEADKMIVDEEDEPNTDEKVASVISATCRHGHERTLSRPTCQESIARCHVHDVANEKAISQPPNFLIIHKPQPLACVSGGADQQQSFLSRQDAEVLKNPAENRQVLSAFDYPHSNVCAEPFDHVVFEEPQRLCHYPPVSSSSSHSAACHLLNSHTIISETSKSEPHSHHVYTSSNSALNKNDHVAGMCHLSQSSTRTSCSSLPQKTSAGFHSTTPEAFLVHSSKVTTSQPHHLSVNASCDIPDPASTLLPCYSVQQLDASLLPVLPVPDGQYMYGECAVEGDRVELASSDSDPGAQCVLRTQPAVSTQHALRTQTVLRTQPAHSTRPAFNTQPVLNAQPMLDTQLALSIQSHISKPQAAMKSPENELPPALQSVSMPVPDIPQSNYHPVDPAHSGTVLNTVQANQSSFPSHSSLIDHHTSTNQTRITHHRSLQNLNKKVAVDSGSPHHATYYFHHGSFSSIAAATTSISTPKSVNDSQQFVPVLPALSNIAVLPSSSTCRFQHFGSVSDISSMTETATESNMGNDLATAASNSSLPTGACRFHSSLAAGSINFPSTPTQSVSVDFQQVASGPAQTVSVDFQPALTQTVSAHFQSAAAQPVSAHFQAAPAQTVSSHFQPAQAQTVSAHYQSAPAQAIAVDFQVVPSPAISVDFPSTPAPTISVDHSSQTTILPAVGYSPPGLSNQGLSPTFLSPGGLGSLEQPGAGREGGGDGGGGGGASCRAGIGFSTVSASVLDMLLMKADQATVDKGRVETDAKANVGVQNRHATDQQITTQPSTGTFGISVEAERDSGVSTVSQRRTEGVDSSVLQTSQGGGVEVGLPLFSGQFCVECNKICSDVCKHGISQLQLVSDSPVLSRARATVPDCLTLKPSSVVGHFNNTGVFSNMTIPAKTQFGPMQGKLVAADATTPCSFSMWKVFYEKSIQMLDLSDENSSNWLMFVKPARSTLERNLTAFQCGGDVFFITTREVQPDTELLYWFAADYIKMICGKSKPPQHCPCCPVCSAVFLHRAEQRHHTKLAHHGDESASNKWACSACPAQFRLHGKLTEHVMTSHMHVKPWACSVCGKEFNDQSNLKTHLAIHEGVRKYGCDICGKHFIQKAHLQTHKTTHTKVKAAQCKFCSKCFARPSDMRQHELQHTQGQSLCCPHCTKTFHRSELLRRHVKSVHENQRNYLCECCSKAFHTKFKLTRHAKFCSVKGKGKSDNASKSSSSSLSSKSKSATSQGKVVSSAGSSATSNLPLSSASSSQSSAILTVLNSVPLVINTAN